MVVGATCGTPAVVRIQPPEREFFSKRLDYEGIPIKAHADVEDAALWEARRRLNRMLREAPDIRQNLVAKGAELHIIGKDQQTSDLPDLRHWKGKLYEGSMTIDQRTRGVGGLKASCGEENLLQLKSDRYRFHRDICTHEFAHTVLSYGLDANTRKLVREQFKASIKAGRWKSAYASKNVQEFFAELSMWYVGSRGDFGRIKPRPQVGRPWLERYDSEAFDLLDRIFSGRIRMERHP